MKKLSLEMLRLTSDEVLGRSQMKKITGGYGGLLVNGFAVVDLDSLHFTIVQRTQRKYVE
ncbi:hypothetical protein M3O96_05600 [Aquiflexum sp. TKW24L]|uniref:hypothetical protein n=1 Tax=Aquiflexum sp. TKW24L TaxID=2942212 RepID=UPI0020C17DD4|nr:hypothetical protein [Aquiflexum sp. TKW24L]MCL6258552.1 hypothetical protein [Aquiflexum sp. TKW24L]